MTDPSEALSALMTACYRHNVRGKNWTAVERSFNAALDVGIEPSDALDHAIALMKQITGGHNGQR